MRKRTFSEVVFNSSLLREPGAVAFVNKLLDEGWLKDEYRGRLKQILIHSIRSDETMCRLPPASKLDIDWRFLCDLRDQGRAAPARWLEHSFDHVGHHSTLNNRKSDIARVSR